MNLKLDQSLVGTPTSSATPLLPQHILEEGQIAGWTFCGWVGVPVSPLEALTSYRQWAVQAPYSLLLWVLIRVTLVELQWVATALDFHIVPQISHNFHISPCTLYLNLLLPIWSLLSSSPPTLRAPTKSILFPFPRKIHGSLLELSLLLSLTVDCSMIRLYLKTSVYL